MNVPFVDLKTQHHVLNKEISEAIAQVLVDASFILGQDVALFEEAFATYCDVGYCVGLDSGTSALELALQAFEVGLGDEVITAANTFVATVSAITATRARPVLVDIDPQTYNMDVAAVARVITPRTRAIIPVHLYGQPVDMDPLLDLARSNGLLIIEDACQAHGALYKGQRVGSIGDAACFSFYPSKNLGACGDGGALVTNDAAIAEKVRALRNYGQVRKHQHRLTPYNRRLDSLQAAILRVKLPHLDDWNARRARHARLYDRLLTRAAVVTPSVMESVEHVYHLYVIRHEDRDALRAYLTERGVETGIHYPIPVHLQEACRPLGYSRGDFPLTERYADQILSLPMYPELTTEQIAYVAEAVVELAPASVRSLAMSEAA